MHHENVHYRRPDGYLFNNSRMPSHRLANTTTYRSSRLIQTHWMHKSASLSCWKTETMTLNNRQHYEMMSVFKFHQALAVCNYLHHHNQSLDTLLHIHTRRFEAQYLWSPLRDADICKEELVDGMDIDVRNLLEYTLQQSDNNACDILFDRLVSPAETDLLSETWD